MPEGGEDGADDGRPHYEGHRARLKARFADQGGDALADYELLELCLFRTIPRKDVKPLAKALIKRFGGFAGVLGAPIELLAEQHGVSDAVALDLKIIDAAARKAGKERVMDRPILSSWSALLDYLRAAMAEERVEQFRLLFLDKRNRLIADEILGRGTVDHAPVYPREVVKRALALHATAVILVHNHPSGDATPSRADIDMTNELVQTAKALDIVVHDHIVVARENVASFKALGLM